MSIETEYAELKKQVLDPIAINLERFLIECLAGMPRIDRISVRVKSVDRFLSKARKLDLRGEPKYSDPLHQIQDQLGARIICFYLDDVQKVSSCIMDYFNNIENRLVKPDEDSKFGYFGKHFVLHLPDEVVDSNNPPLVNLFELQIKTLFQHAWSEAEHDLSYKPLEGLSADMHRKIAFTAAQAWGADQIFNELFNGLAASNEG